MRILLAVILVATTMSGCFGSSETPAADEEAEAAAAAAVVAAKQKTPVSPVLYSNIILSGGLVASSIDGVPLRYDVSRPDTTDPVPIILVQSPYWSFGGDAKDSDRPTWYIDYFVPRGYAVALGEMRGTRDSGGCWDFGGGLDRQDGADMVEGLAAQPWSNGNVGMLGQSHVGMSQVAAAVMAPPALKAIVPIAAVTDWYRYLHKEGAPYTLNRATPPAYFAVHASPSTPDVHGREPLENWLLTQAQTACVDNVIHVSQSAELDGDKDAYWQDRDLIARSGDTRAAVFLVHGFLDENVKTDHFLDYWHALPDDIPKKAWFGQWFHEHPSYVEWREDVHRWFDYHLKGIDNAIVEAPPVTIQDNLYLNRTETDWPTGFTVHEFGLEYTALVPGPAEGASIDISYAALPGDDRSAVPSPMDGVSTYWPFNSPPFDAPLHITGEALLNLTGTLSAPEARWIAVLYDASPSGQLDEISRGYLDARHRNGPATNELVTPFAEVDYQVRFFPRDHVVPAGHHLELVLFGNDMGCNVPGLGTDPSPYAGTCEGTGILPVAEPVLQSVATGRGGSSLFLPIVDMPGPERVLTPLEDWL